jgi:hypothetical protein
MKKVFTWFTNPPTDGPKSTIALRLMAGGVFLWEGILKFVYANQGIGRFTKLGMPMPHFTADFVACLEIVGGLLLLSGWLTRLPGGTRWSAPLLSVCWESVSRKANSTPRAARRRLPALERR